MIHNETNGAEAGQQPYRAFVEAAVAVQEQNVRFALGMFGMLAGQAEAGRATARVLAETSRMQQEAFHAMAEESFKTYTDFLYGHALEEVVPQADDTVPELPVDGYDGLDAEELGSKLKGLCIDDVERLKAHEKGTRNRRAMLERLDRALV